MRIDQRYGLPVIEESPEQKKINDACRRNSIFVGQLKKVKRLGGMFARVDLSPMAKRVVQKGLFV